MKWAKGAKRALNECINYAHYPLPSASVDGRMEKQILGALAHQPVDKAIDRSCIRPSAKADGKG
jgi:hypothetical protein